LLLSVSLEADPEEEDEGALLGAGLDGLGLAGTLVLPVVSGNVLLVPLAFWAWAMPPRPIRAVVARAIMEVRMLVLVSYLAA
jgi:hypothetical protein